MNSLINSAILTAIVILLLLLAGNSELYAQGRGQAGGPGGGMRQPPTVDQVFAREDKDDDGLISQDEFGGPAEHFPLFDTDGDGYLTREEVTASLQNPPPRNGRGGHDRGNDQRSGQNGPPQMDFTRMDLDDDGVLSAEEFIGPEDLFSMIDADQDGSLTEEEFDNAPSRIPSPGNGGRSN